MNNLEEILESVIISYFDYHPLALQPIFMDDNDRLHRDMNFKRIENLANNFSYKWVHMKNWCWIFICLVKLLPGNFLQ